MTTDDNSNTENLVDMDDLEAFEDEFFQREKPAEEDKSEEVNEEVSENEDDPLAAEEDTDAPAETGDDAEEEEDDEDSEEESEPEPKQKPKSKAQQRIEKLLERERLANERATALEQRLAALEARKAKEETQEEQAPALRDQLPADAPNPDAKDKDGNPLYPLGEFDPQFIRDFTKFTIDAEMKVKQEQEQREAQDRLVAEQRREIQTNWNTKLEAAEEEIPDLRESISDLVDTFQGVEPAYGEYLASVIMASDLGPQLMYYLSQNIGEAQKIVASGPAAATLALGRLEARLAPTSKEEKRNASTKRVSEAPRPPEARTRGAGGKFAVPDDTDDLDAFERKFFKK